MHIFAPTISIIIQNHNNMIKIEDIKTHEDVGRFIKEMINQKEEYKARARQKIREMEAAGII